MDTQTSTPPQPELLPAVKFHKDSIVVGKRMRQDLGTPEELNELAESIKEHGLIHPLAIDENKNLVAGGRRYHVLTTILKWEWIPVSLASTGGSQAKLRMMELEENIRRKDMDWKERVRTVAEVHELHKNDAALNSSKWTLTQTGELLDLSIGNVQYCVTMVEYLDKKDHPVHKATSLNEAFRILLEIKENEINRENSKFAQEIAPSKGATSKGATLSIDSLLKGIQGTETGEVKNVSVDEMGKVLAELQATETPQEPLPQGQKEKLPIEVSRYFRRGDSIELMNSDSEGSADHIITDIPYGIEMNNLSQAGESYIDIDRVSEEHDVESNIKLIRNFFPAAYRVLKENAFCVIWIDLTGEPPKMIKSAGCTTMWEFIFNQATAAGFKPQKWPYHWIKTHRCKNQAAQYNFTKAVEHAIILRKGNATLVSPQGTNYFIGGNEDAVAEFGHPFAKPKGLWKALATAVAVKSSIILDPFAGSFSGPLAFAEAGFYPRGIELKEEHFNKGIHKFKELMSGWFPDKEVVFT